MCRMNIGVSYCMADDLTFVTVQYCLQNFESLRAEQMYLDDCGDQMEIRNINSTQVPVL